MELLINKGAHVNQKNKDGGTPLHYASLYGRTETVYILIFSGANINEKDNLGETPLHYGIFAIRIFYFKLSLINKCFRSFKIR